MANGTISEEEWLDLYRHLLTVINKQRKLCVGARHGTRPKGYEDFFAAARFSAQYFFEASMMRFFPAALSVRFGFSATVASGLDTVFFAAHLFC